MADHPFELEIEQTFRAYQDASIADLMLLPVKTAPCGIRHPKTNAPLYMRSGKSPYDIVGVMHNDGRMVGVEIKSSRRKASLPIIMPGKQGDGLQFHQLESLSRLAAFGGIARVIWNNEGEVGVIKGAKIMNVFANANTALKVMAGGLSNPKPGLKSVKWDQFSPVAYRAVGNSGVPIPDWLAL
jgi:penicillin-binding protein-related factor A (putative recombinase)